MADELKPCPFCGGNNVSTFGPYGWYRNWGISHSCKSFYSGSQEMFQGFATEAEAIEAWNTRTETRVQATIDELVRAADYLCVCAQTTGGTPKPDGELRLAIELYAQARKNLSRHGKESGNADHR